MIEIKENYKLRDLTSMKVGGEARYYVELKAVEDFSELKTSFPELAKMKKLIVGACTNLVISDQGFDGLVIKNKIDFIDLDGQNVEAGAGTLLPKLALITIDEGLSGLERVGNVPGTIGGAIWGNAEAHHQAISDDLISVRWGDFAGGTMEIKKEDCAFAYRSSIFKTDRQQAGIILSAKFKFTTKDKSDLRQVWEADQGARRETQPRDFSCGCFFKNIVLTSENRQKIEDKFGGEVLAGRKVGDNFSAGRLIDLAGLKGECRGDACISQVHANFLVNKGKASAAQVHELFLFVRDTILEKVGIELENEVQFAGDF